MYDSKLIISYIFVLQYSSRLCNNPNTDKLNYYFTGKISDILLVGR